MIKLELSPAELDVIMKYLGTGAFNEVAPIVAKVHGQALPQVQAQQAEKKAEDDQP